MTFIRPLLEYSCEVWNSYTVADADRLEQLQLEAVRIVTGLTTYAGLPSWYTETGWVKLYARHKLEKLSVFYNIVKGYSLLLKWFAAAISTFFVSSHYSSLE